MYNPKVSICVPIYGVEKSIEKCARSIFEQTYLNIEFIFVNDCTPDNSISILKEIINEYPERQPHVHIIHHKKNRGLAAARNTAVAECKTEFLMHVDSDDWIEKDCVKDCVKKQEENQADIVIIDFLMHHKTYTLYKERPALSSIKEFTLKILDKTAMASVCGALIKTALYKNNNISAQEGLNIGEDYYVMPRLSFYSKKISAVSKPLYHYDFTNEDSYTHTAFSEAKKDLIWAVSQLLKDFFVHHDGSYIDAIKRAEVFMAVLNIIDSLKYNDYPYIEKSYKRLNSLDFKYYRSLSLQYWPYILIRNKSFLKYYTKLAGGVKRLIMSIFKK